MLFNYYDLRTSFTRASFTESEAKEIAELLGISFEKEKFTLEDFTLGINVELEHGTKNLETNVTHDDSIITGKIALAHLREIPDYYIRLKKLEEEAAQYWDSQKNKIP